MDTTHLTGFFSLSTVPARNSGVRILTFADSGGRVVQGAGLRPRTFWDCWFQTRRGHGRLSLATVVCCRVKVSASGLSPVQRSPTKWCVCVCVYHWMWSSEITLHTYREKVEEGRLSKKSKNAPSGKPWLIHSTLSQLIIRYRPVIRHYKLTQLKSDRGDC